MPSTYTAIDLAKPDGATQAGTAHSQSARDNFIAEAVAIVAGELEDYAYSQTVGTGDQLRPQYEFWKDGANWVRVTNTWGTSGGQDGNLTQRVIEWSTDSGSSYATVKTITYSYHTDGSLTSSTNGGGFSGRLAMLWGWIKKIATHLAATGTAVHGLGSIATQAANNVAITGGTVDIKYLREAVVALGNISSPTAVDWSLGGWFTATVTGASAALTWSNLPSGKVGYIVLEITDGGDATALLPAGTRTVVGSPTWSGSGKNIAVFACRDGLTVTLVGFGLDAAI